MATAQRLSGEIRGLEPGDIDRALITRLVTDLTDLRAKSEGIQELLAGDPLVGAARGITQLQKPLAEAEALLIAADDLTAAAELALQLGDRFVALREGRTAGSGSMLAGMVELIATSTSPVDEVQQRIERAGATLATIPPDALPEIRRAADMMAAPIREYGPLLAEYRELDDVLPLILGWHSERRYLVLAQNPAELRPTGGYTGTVGIVTFRDGDLAEQDFMDVYELDLKPGIPFVEPPEGLQSHLLGDASWQLADANWSPDFPTAAQDALRLYTLESGDDRVDGVIGLTTFAIDRLLEVTGPVEVADYGVTVRPGEVTLTALGLTRGISTPTSDRKAFLDSLAKTVLDRLYALPAAQWPALLEAFEEMSERRLMLAWFKDPAAEGLVDGSAMAGAVRQDPGDYLYIVEANVAPTSKYNLVVRRRTLLEAVIQPDGDVENRLRLVWQNDAGDAGEPYASIRSYSTSTVGLYGAYIRVLVPIQSELVEAAGESDGPISGAESVATAAGRSTFANYLLIAPGAAELRYSWLVPGAVQRRDGEWRYLLTIQKQPGMTDEPVTVAVTLPSGAVVTSLPEEATMSGGTITFTTVLKTDRLLQIGYRLP